MISATVPLFFQLCLAALVAAAPIADETMTATKATPWQYGTGGGIIGFIVLVLDIIVFIEVLKSNRPPVNKLIWCLVVFLFPIIGMAVYFIFSNRKAHNTYEPLP
ncbi:hypothetical protein UCREL1_10583 [Eutypa lata UCREL1]|uniref:Cardiolipin synthase N-terminal domain-containing protein n=1 Tax=Eutypa lata (strain UCR-EL1) TaxID=1287681 RepID=M7SY27_EUTLA|nr:hypothetical protein UCREL1_10583 [Eutypa lata UCREL1]